MNKLLGKNHRIRTYEINKMYWSCFDDKTFILDKAKKLYVCGYPTVPAKNYRP